MAIKYYVSWMGAENNGRTIFGKFTVEITGPVNDATVEELSKIALAVAKKSNFVDSVTIMGWSSMN